MTEQQWRDAWKLYQSGSSLPQEQVHAFLRGAEADPEVRDAVLAMFDRTTKAGSLDPVGQRIGRYVVTERLGAGGMGEVFAARDLELDRLVAVKLLAPLTAGKSSALDRFIHEAKAASALNHPNIVTIYEVIQASSRLAIVMELVDGTPLRQLCGSPLPVDRVIHISAQVAHALAAAHARGIVHCDIKPENLMVRNDGIVKMLDFGLARDLGDVTSRSVFPAGTLQYLSPERCQGEAPSPGTDIFALGIVLYELSAGTNPFATTSLFDTLKNLNHADPPPPSASNPFVPPQLDTLILRMLAKDASLRPTAAEVALQLESRSSSLPAALPAQSMPTPATSKPAAPKIATPKSAGHWLLPLALAVLISAAGAVIYFSQRAPNAPAIRFSFDPPFRTRALNVAVSPDGTRIAFSGISGESGLWLRSTNSMTSESLPGTEAAMCPFWSPDGRSIGFITYALGVRKIELSNGPAPPQTITPVASNYAGAAWSSRGVILFVPQSTGSGLFRVPASGGTPVPVTRLNPARMEISHRYPQFLPDGKHFLYWVWSTLDENTGVYVGSLDSDEKLPSDPLVRTWREARYADSGHLLFLEGTTLMARPFDPDKLRFTGEPVSLAEPVGRHWESTGRAMFSAAGSRALVYQEALPPRRSSIVIRSRTGKLLRTIAVPPGTQWPSLNPQDTHMVFQGVDENTLEALWILDLARGIPARLTATRASDQRPIWSVDGRHIVFSSNRSGAYDLYLRKADGPGDDELLVKSPVQKSPESWSPDGRFLIYTDAAPDTRGDLWALPMEGDRKPAPLLKTESSEYLARVSPTTDSQRKTWMLYASEKTGVGEIYLRPLSPGVPDKAAGVELRISGSGGGMPCWRRDGKELFYVEPGAGKEKRMMAVDVRLTNPPVISAPRKLFDLNPDSIVGCTVFADGQRFAYIEPAGEDQAAKINVVLNWTAGLKK